MSTAPLAFARGIDRLRRRRAALLGRIHELDASLRGCPPAPGSWSALEVLEHLVIAEESTLRSLGEGRTPARMAPAWRATLNLTLVLVVFRLPVRVKTPSPRLLPAGGLALDVLEARWAAVAGGLEQHLATLPAGRRRARVFRHPVAGWLRLDQMLRFHSAHITHHARQIGRIRRALGAHGG